MSSVMRFDEWQDSNGVPLLDGSGGSITVPKAFMPTGSILQVVSTTKADTFTTTSATYIDIPSFSVSITPSSTNSRILVCLSAKIATAQNANFANVAILRNSTPIFVGDTAGSRDVDAQSTVLTTGANEIMAVTSSFVDSPATTSALTYKAQLRVAPSGTAYFNRSASDTDNSGFSRVASSIIVMEVAG